MRFQYVVLLVSLAAIGCMRSSAVEPGVTDGAAFADTGPSAEVSSNHHLWGIWDVTIDPATQSVEVIPRRGADMHLNAVRLLEVAPCSNCLKIGNVKLVEPNVLEADVTLTHPYPGLLEYTGFDVRGIFISEANYTFPASGRKVAWGTGVPVVLNADGYTSLFNPTEFPDTNPGPPALKYIPGKKATGGDLSATLNPFLAYRRDAPRRMFEAGGSETRTVRLYAPPGPIHFGYAVDACWQSVENVVDPVKDFPPDANCLEAYKTNVDFPYDLESSWMSQNPVNVEVFDHQGIGTISAVTIEAPDIFAGEVALTLSAQTGEESWLFSGYVTNEAEAVHGTYPYLVKVTDTEADQNLGAIQAWAAGSARVKEGWARTWGGVVGEYAYSVTIDASGNAYVVGSFGSTVDFNPGIGVDKHTANGAGDAFLGKFGPGGDFLWACSWGGSVSYPGDCAYSVAIDPSGNAYVAGSFCETVDFDPGSGVDDHTSEGWQDAFLSKFDSTGDFIGVRTWGGPSRDYAWSVALDPSGNACVTGYFHGTVDFDPGSEVDNHTSNTNGDDFLSKFDSNGDFLWARTWRGSGEYRPFALAASDAWGSAYVTGSFLDTVDLDPSSGVDDHTSNGSFDAFLSKFDSSGSFLFALTWGGAGGDYASSVAIVPSGNAYVVGHFYDTVDFDPGSGVDDRTSNGVWDTYLSAFDSDGNFEGVRTWGSVSTDSGSSVAIDGSGNAYVSGSFSGTADFDPGSGVDNHTSNGIYDAFMSKFDSSGNFLWAHTWGAAGFDSAVSVATDGSGNAYVTGNFEDTVDFDPGSGAENHTSIEYQDAFLVKFLPDGNW